MRGDDRPDPDALLEQIGEDERRHARGRLKIFFGACAGVGKTYAMLAAAHAHEGPLAVGIVETHGRPETEAMARELPRLPLMRLAWRGRELPEFDLDAALAFAAGKPGALVLLDELAHSNVPGSRHPKRWQDVEELLEAGVDVWSTMNVQHLESLNDIVSGITGIRVHETVPDRLFDDADEVVVVDLPPDELLQRLKAGKVYLPHGDDNRAERAAANFFRKGNLLALRELALRRTADRVDGQMQAYRRRSAAAQPVWPNREALLACIGSGDHGEKIVRTCARLAAQLDVPWHAMHVETPGFAALPAAALQQRLRVLKLADELGASTATRSAGDPAEAIVRYAREHNLARVVIGMRQRRWRWRRPLADRIARLTSDLDVLLVALPASRRARPWAGDAAPSRQPWIGYAAAAAACAATAAMATPLLGWLELSNIVMLFLLTVVGVALAFGRGPAVFAAVVGVVLFDVLFVPPRFSLAVSDAQYLVTFAVMLLVGLLIGQLTAGLKVQALAATQRERGVRSLYEMARDLSSALLPEQVAEVGARFLKGEFDAHATLLAADEKNRLQPLPGGRADFDLAVAQWSFDRGENAGRGTDTLPSSRCLVLPLKAPMRTRGVLAVEPRDGAGGSALWSPDQRQLLETCASLLAISLERIHYIDVAQRSTMQIESERLRNSLLSAISHDLRTPLAALVGLADSLALGPHGIEAGSAQHAIAQSIRQSALRMNTLVGNLLDMARLEAGALRLDRAWQPLEEVVGSALAACTSALQGRDVSVRLPDTLPLVEIDAVLMERVFANLLENAAKYTPPGSAIELAAAVEGDRVVITVDDHGAGLPPGREELLFEKFERGVKESATPGVGLGLAICRAIVQAHGGTIVGSNRIDAGGVGGARFTIRLPLGHPPADDGTALAAAAADAVHEQHEHLEHHEDAPTGPGGVSGEAR